ncbi:uncharacterized protein BXZ73DRAFT_98670 [Epithele typhae]|uniref:uncharacterized protein n=1 Tax=Epithele typhae TaxID=378194 RepID=UPI0020071ED4|nr:uncharacterized protein BXZ73DRAFT_98670 [Epithele typhae]KAH9940838.1 hypothetical protein BXZ73DRAFT_98670 [Epithele typhae]
MSSQFAVVSFTPFPQQQRRMSASKYIERRIICAWKALNRRSRRHRRTSVVPEDFVILTGRRRSVRYV